MDEQLGSNNFLCEAGLGGDGEEFQRRIALILLQRCTLWERRFRLAFEMTAAGKFDDVGLLLEQPPNGEHWWLIQAKHSEAGGMLLEEMLLPDDDLARKKGNFSLFKYLESYCLVEDYWVHGGNGKKFVILTNKELDSAVDSEGADGVDEMLKFSYGGNHRKIKPSEEMIDKLEQYINRDFESICSAIKELFTAGKMNHILKSFKTPLMPLFSSNNGQVNFAENFVQNNQDPRLCRLFRRIEKDFRMLDLDIATIAIDSATMGDFWTGKSRNKMLPPSIDRATVEKFFEDLVLATSQPNVDQLLTEINREWRLWMRSWIRPDDLGRLSSGQLELPFNTFRKFFHEWEKSTTSEGVKKRTFLELTDGQRFLKEVANDLGDFVRKCSKRSCLAFRDVERYFVHRQIGVVKDLMHTGIDQYALDYAKIKDTDFVDQIYSTFGSQRRFVLVAEPGMGKSVLWQYLAFYAQQIYPETSVFLLYMNNFDQQLPPAETLEDVLDVFETDLSTESLQIFRNENAKVLLFMDAYDELSKDNLKRVENYITILLHRDNLKILISSRRRLANLLEKTLNIKAMKLERFDKSDQIEFLRKFWNVTDSDGAKFQQFAENLLAKFHRDIQRQNLDFTGLPLMIQMLAEVYSESYCKFVQSDVECSESSESITVVELYEKFTEKSIKMTIDKKMNVADCHEIPYFDEITELCKQDYQIAAINMILPVDLLREIIDKRFSNRLKIFIKRIVDEETLLVEIVAGTPQFIHLSYAEYFTAGYFYKLIDHLQNVPCSKNFVDFLASQDGVRNFFFAMINANSTENHLKFIKTIGDRAAFWSCQGDHLTLVSYLQQFYNYNKIRQNQPDWSWLFEDDEDEIVRQCCQLGVTALLGPSMLHTAVEHNAHKTLQVLLGPASRIDVNVRDYKKATPLHYAAKNGNLPIVQALISKGAKVNAADRDGYTALHIAAYEGHRELVRCLVVDHSAKVDCLSRFRETPGMLALKQKHTAIVELLEAREK